MGKIALEIHEPLQEKLYYIEYAAFYGSIDCIDFLLSLGSEPKQAASYAVAGGNIECIKYCVNKSFPVNKMIVSALKSYRFELIDQLLEIIGPKGPDHLKHNFFHCARNNNIIGMHTCLKHGVEINATDIAECSALIYAAANGALRPLTFLVEAGADPSLCDITGWNALHFASKYGFIEVVKYLTTLPSIDINAKTGIGKTALHIACEESQLNVILHLLSLPGINIDCTDSKKQTAFSLITSADVKKSIDTFLSSKQEPSS